MSTKEVPQLADAATLQHLPTPARITARAILDLVPEVLPVVSLGGRKYAGPAADGTLYVADAADAATIEAHIASLETP